MSPRAGCSRHSDNAALLGHHHTLNLYGLRGVGDFAGLRLRLGRLRASHPDPAPRSNARSTAIAPAPCRARRPRRRRCCGTSTRRACRLPARRRRRLPPRAHERLPVPHRLRAADPHPCSSCDCQCPVFQRPSSTSNTWGFPGQFKLKQPRRHGHTKGGTTQPSKSRTRNRWILDPAY